MTESEIVAQLASSEDFKRVGIERFLLTSLQFHVEMRDQGHAVLRVSSAQPMTEPYLNFLVQVIWPNGRLLKDLPQILLNHPHIRSTRAGRRQSGERQRRRTRRSRRTDTDENPIPRFPSVVHRSTQPATQPQPPSDRLTGDSYGVTDRDDTLWRIAQRARPSENVTVQQSMLAIARMNPEAFIGGNVNLLKAGYTLRLPKEADVEAISKAEAVSEVASQNQAWQAYRRGEGLASVAPPRRPRPTRARRSQGRWTPPRRRRWPQHRKAPMVNCASSRATHRTTDRVGSRQRRYGGARKPLAAAKEEADRIALNETTPSRVSQGNVAGGTTQRQIEVRDQQIAQMQEQLKAAKGAAAAAPAPAEEGRRQRDRRASGVAVRVGRRGDRVGTDRGRGNRCVAREAGAATTRK